MLCAVCNIPNAIAASGRRATVYRCTRSCTISTVYYATPRLLMCGNIHQVHAHVVVSILTADIDGRDNFAFGMFRCAVAHLRCNILDVRTRCVRVSCARNTNRCDMLCVPLRENKSARLGVCLRRMSHVSCLHVFVRCPIRSVLMCDCVCVFFVCPNVCHTHAIGYCRFLSIFVLTNKHSHSRTLTHNIIILCIDVLA